VRTTVRAPLMLVAEAFAKAVLAGLLTGLLAGLLAAPSGATQRRTGVGEPTTILVRYHDRPDDLLHIQPLACRAADPCSKTTQGASYPLADIRALTVQRRGDWLGLSTRVARLADPSAGLMNVVWRVKSDAHVEAFFGLVVHPDGRLRFVVDDKLAAASCDAAHGARKRSSSSYVLWLPLPCLAASEWVKVGSGTEVFAGRHVREDDALRRRIPDRLFPASGPPVPLA
jgi:hypothetical protein